MQVEVEYPIVVRGRPKRSPLNKLILARDTVLVDIPEYSSSELVRAIDLRADFGDGMTEYRLDALEGGLYASVGGVEPHAGLHSYVFGNKPEEYAAFTSEANADAMADVWEALRLKTEKLFPPQIERAVRLVKAEAAFVPPMLSDVRGQIAEREVELAQARFMAHMDRFIIVDGLLMRQELEPVIVVTVDRYASDRVTLMAIRRDGMRPALRLDAYGCIPDAVFRIDQSEDALLYARELVAASSELASLPVLRNYVDSGVVLDTELLKFDERSATLESIADWMLVNLDSGLSHVEEMGTLRRLRSQSGAAATAALEETIGKIRSLPVSEAGNLFSCYGAELLPVLWSRLGEPDVVYDI